MKNMKIFIGIMMFVFVASLCVSSIASAQGKGKKGKKGLKALQAQIEEETAARETADTELLQQVTTIIQNTPGPQGEQGECDTTITDDLQAQIDELFGLVGGVTQTGQTTIYATGDDADLQKGVALPNPRFTDNGDGTVTDFLLKILQKKD